MACGELWLYIHDEVVAGAVQTFGPSIEALCHLFIWKVSSFIKTLMSDYFVIRSYVPRLTSAKAKENTPLITHVYIHEYVCMCMRVFVA